jgi:hypothetical protein
VTDVNYDEALVGDYVLPDPLVATDGTPITGVAAWESRRRPELLELFATHVYGRTPARRLPQRWELTSQAHVLEGRAVRREVSIFFGPGGERCLHLLLYVPVTARPAPEGVPAFLGLNFFGNQSVHPDPGIALTRRWVREAPDRGVVDHRATEATRGIEASRWPVEAIVERGYALVTAHYADLEPDFVGGVADGVRPLFHTAGELAAPDDWGAIGAWAWGLSRALDYLEADPDVDARRVAVLGHSRLGKAALWAGAQDPRFALVISNGSGAGGAKLARRNYGETIERLNTRFPAWFCANYRRYDHDPHALPVDQHQLLALVAPRPLYIASAEEDLWADPRGEFLAALAAERVWRLYDRAGLGAGASPAVGESVGAFVGYHVRPGKHDVTAFDWRCFLAFADRHLGPR